MSAKKTPVKGIYIEQNGFFMVRVTRKCPLSGKTVEKRERVKSFDIQSAIECKQQLVKDLEEELSEGSNNFRDITKAKYSSYVQWYLDYQLSNGIIRKNVEKGDRDVFNRMILPIIGEVKLTSITKRVFLHFVEELKKQTDRNGIPFAEATYKRGFRLAKASLRFACKMGFLVNDPTHLVVPRFVNVKKEKPKTALTREQASMLLKAAQKHDQKFYFMTLLGIVSGIRWCELTALQYSCFDWENSCIHIHKSQHHGHLNHKVKNGKAHSIPMVEILANASQEYFRTYGRNKGQDDFLFLSKYGNFLNVAGYNRNLKKICSSLGIPEITFHQLRATCNVLYLAAGYSQAVVSKILNHSSPQMTFHYNRMQNEQKQEVMEGVWSLKAINE